MQFDGGGRLRRRPKTRGGSEPKGKRSEQDRLGRLTVPDAERVTPAEEVPEVEVVTAGEEVPLGEAVAPGEEVPPGEELEIPKSAPEATHSKSSGGRAEGN